MKPFDEIVFVYYLEEIDGLVEVRDEKVAQTLADINHTYIVFESTLQEVIDFYGIVRPRRV